MRRLATVALLSFIFCTVGNQARAQDNDEMVGSVYPGRWFHVGCPRFEYLVGLDIYSWESVNAIRPVCAPAYGPTEIGRFAPVGEPLGGQADGKQHTRLMCGGPNPVVTGAYVKARYIDGFRSSAVNSIHLYCGVAGSPGEFAAQVPSARFDAPGGAPGKDDGASHYCRPSFAVGIKGSVSGWLHTLGLICGEAHFAVKKVGRTKPKLDPKVQEVPGVASTFFCRKYAQDAVDDAARSIADRCGGTGGRWTTDFDRHFDWCMTLNGDRTQANAETAARQAALRQCSGSR